MTEFNTENITFPRTIIQIFIQGIKIFAKNLPRLSIITAVCMLVSAPIGMLVAYGSFSDLDSFAIGIETFETLVSILLNAFILAIIPKLINGNQHSLTINIRVLLHNFISLVFLLAIIQMAVQFIIIQLVPSLALLTGILLIFTPLFCFYPPRRSIVNIFISGVMLVVENFPKLLLFLILNSLLYILVMACSILILSFFGYIEFFTNLYGVLSVSDIDNEQIKEHLNEFFHSPRFAVFYILFHFIYQPLKSLLVCLLFLHISCIKHSSGLVRFWNLFSFEDTEQINKQLSNWEKQ